MAETNAISERQLKVLMPSLLLGVIAFWLLPTFGIDIRLEREAGLVLGIGILLLSIAFGFGKHLKWWVQAPLAMIGSFLFLLAGTTVIR
jgi:4-hydroxybenzoate polyprenyltransferase